MLAGTVDACKWFFMEQTDQVVTQSHFFHRFHNKLVVIGRNVGCIINRSQFMLGRRHFVMLCLGSNPEFPEFFVL